MSEGDFNKPYPYYGESNQEYVKEQLEYQKHRKSKWFLFFVIIDSYNYIYELYYTTYTLL